MSNSEVNRPGGGRPADSETSAEARISRAVFRARANLFWEAIWPLAAPFVVLAAGFAALSWLGLWRLTSTPARFAILAGFAAVLVWLVWRTLRITIPSRAAAFARVEQATGVMHRPATAFTDRLASRPDDPLGIALWTAHRKRVLAALDRLRAGVPSPRLDARDPYAVRFLVALLFIVGFVVAGPERIGRLGEAFLGGESTAEAVARIDAWVTPPTYTNRPPIFLTGDAARPAGSQYSVPTGSVVTVRTGGSRDLGVVSIAGEAETPVAPAETIQKASASNAVPPLEHQVKLEQAGSVVVRKSGREIAGWRFSVEPDNAPKIALVGTTRAEQSGAFSLTYSLEDDYGVVSALGEIAPLSDAGGNGARPLYEPPALPLSLPQLRARSGNGETTRDLTSHPWAGAKVKLTLVAKDEAGQEGRSVPAEVILPARHFTNPLARAVVEQRANLALDANAADRVADAIDALTMAPEKTIKDAGAYIALRTAYYRLVRSHGDEDLKGVVDYLWTVALGIEDGDLSLIAQTLRDAQEALRKALENGASDEEIKRLTEELRQAMQQFMQALAEQARRNPQSAQPNNPNARQMRPQDLQRMLDRIENLARTGARDAARQLLSELQNMLENLQAGRPMMGEQNDQMMESLNQLGEMIQKQEELMNRTHRADRGQNPESGDGQPMTKEELEQALKQLQEGQQALEKSLKELMEQLQAMGMEPNGKFDQAGEAMGKATGSLGQGKPGAAVGSQGDALEALRQGAQGLSQQLANRMGRGNGQGRPGGVRGDNFPNQDPLGRPQRTVGPDLGTTVKVPDEIDTQRAREILDAIRRRLGDFGLPDIERDYLERLLQPF